MPFTSLARSRKASAALWTLQALLAVLFVFAGGTKLLLPIAALTQQTPLPGTFIRFIGVLEVLGGLGLVLPGLLRLNALLTPFAAGGLILVMSGAVGATLTLPNGPPAAAIVPVIVGILLLIVSYGRVARLDFNRVLTFSGGSSLW